MRLFAVGFILILAGFFFLLAGTIGSGNVSSGGVIFIGPLPIVFGSGPYGGELALLSVVIGAIMVILLTIFFWRARSLAGQ